MRNDHFIGRNQEVEVVSKWLLKGGFVTLTGPGGVGKTRLVREALSRRKGAPTAGRVLFCELSRVRTVQGLVTTVSRAWGVESAEDTVLEDSIERLAGLLPMLGGGCLVLDNFEQLGADAADVVRRWHERAPHIAILVTSRRALGVAGESVYQVEPLPTDEAVELLEARVRRWRPELDIRSAQPVLERIVTRLDTLPLALEMAGARARLLSLNEIDARLERRFEFLVSRDRAEARRHQSLYATIEWSWDLLDDGAREVLLMASVFEFSFSVRDIEGVMDPARGAMSARWLGDVVEDLLDSSMLRMEPADADGERRFRLFESVRAFAREKLAETPREAAVLESFARHIIADGESSRRAMEGPDGLVHIQRLKALVPEFMRVNECMKDQHPEIRARACLLLTASFQLRATTWAQHQWLGEAQRAIKEAGAKGLEAILYLYQGHAYIPLSQPEVVFARAHRAIKRAGQHGDTHTEVRALLLLGWLAGVRDDVERARTSLERAAEVATGANDLAGLGRVLMSRGQLEIGLSNWSEGAVFLERSAALLAEFSNPAFEAKVLSLLGFVAAHHRQSDAASRFHERALELHRQAGNLPAVAASIQVRATAALNLTDFESAHKLATESLRIYTEIGHFAYMSGPLLILAATAHARGEAMEANRLYRQAIVSARQLHSLRERVASVYLVVLLLEEGRDHEAKAVLEGVKETRNSLVDGLALGLRAVFSAAKSDDDEVAAQVEHARVVLAQDPVTPADQLARYCHVLATLMSGDTPEALRLLAEARATELAVPSLEIGLLTRAVDARLAREVEGRSVLVVDEPCARLELPDGQVIDLSRRHSIRRIMQALVESRLREPGTVVNIHDLFEIGWPGDGAAPDVGANRVYYSISVLRQMGLEAILLSGEEGYFLSPAWQVTQSCQPS